MVHVYQIDHLDPFQTGKASLSHPILHEPILIIGKLGFMDFDLS
jgi:hypothetical protein